MTKSRGRGKERRLADMTVHPEPDPIYELPPEDECEEYESGEILSINHELRARFVLWQDKFMVEFAVIQLYLDGAKWEQVARIDTCHSKVHKHQLQRGSDDLVGTVQDFVIIPAVGGWEIVDKWYDDSLTLMHKSWRENLRVGGW